MKLKEGKGRNEMEGSGSEGNEGKILICLDLLNKEREGSGKILS